VNINKFNSKILCSSGGFIAESNKTTFVADLRDAFHSQFPLCRLEAFSATNIASCKQLKSHLQTQTI